MNEKTKTEKEKQLETYFRKRLNALAGLPLSDFINIEQLENGLDEEDAEALVDEAIDGGVIDSEAEIIYYDDAMEYLTEHDNSLEESLELASDLGFETQNINSTTLATLLKTQHLTEEIDYNKEKVVDFLVEFSEKPEIKVTKEDEKQIKELAEILKSEPDYYFTDKLELKRCVSGTSTTREDLVSRTDFNTYDLDLYLKPATEKAVAALKQSQEVQSDLPKMPDLGKNNGMTM